MKTITFECETITPMFLAGADGKTPELRPPSIKGAMRFWWRAMNGHLVTEKDGKWDYSKLKEEEAKIFGGTETKSNLIISINEITNFKLEDYISNQTYKNSNYGNDLKYLAFGVYERHFIKEGFTFQVTLRYNLSWENEILDSFFCLSYFGGIGSKSRNGFGQFIIKGDFWRSNIFSKINNELNDRKYSSFTKDYFIEVIKDKNAIRVLKKMAKIYKNAISELEKEDRNFIAKRNSKFQIKGTEIYERIAKTFFISINKIDKIYEGSISYLPFIYPVNYEKYSDVINEFSDVIESSFEEINEETQL